MDGNVVGASAFNCVTDSKAANACSTSVNVTFLVLVLLVVAVVVGVVAA